MSSTRHSSVPGVYNFPFHEALMALGFREVSYTHHLGSLAPRPAGFARPGALVCGFAGDAGSRISSVDVELAVVAELTGGTLDALPNVLPGVVHLAGHADTGSRAHEVGMWLGPAAAPLSAASVLLDIDASATSLVFLSACSTGAGVFFAGELIGAVPLDVAFLEKGAQVVVSTSAPVNDQVACFFACVFHYELGRGASIWESYRSARQATASASLGDGRPELESMLSARWPGWQGDIEGRIVDHDETWRLFRLSGRHW